MLSPTYKDYGYPYGALYIPHNSLNWKAIVLAHKDAKHPIKHFLYKLHEYLVDLKIMVSQRYSVILIVLGQLIKRKNPLLKVFLLREPF